MKVARIQSSLRDLNKDIGNCERQLSRVLNVKDSEAEAKRSRSVNRNVIPKAGYRQPNATASHLSRSVSKQTTDCQRKPRSPTRVFNSSDRSVICKEVIGNKHSPTRVEVVVRTKPSRRRSRSMQASRQEQEIPTRDHSGKSRNSNARHSLTHGTQRRNASWAHILQQQSSSTCNDYRSGQDHGKACTALHYSSTDDERSSIELERWVQSIPRGKDRGIHHRMSDGNSRKGDATDGYYSTFNPLRMLNFLVKELRGKVHENYDEGLQRIIDDMEKALCSIPGDVNQASPPTKLTAAQNRTKSSVSDANGTDSIRGKERPKLPYQDPKEIIFDSSPNLINRLLSTVSRISKITGLSEATEETSHMQGSKHSGMKSPALEGTQAQLELGCKQLEDTCRQMRESYENLKQQKDQLLNELKQKSQQLETIGGKNQQLTLYAADIRQEMLRQQQSSEMALQEHEKLSKKLLNQQRELQESNSHLNRRLEETVKDNERLITELQLCRLEKDKMHILMSNKDLEVVKLKKEIIDINTLVAEQLTNIRFTSGKKSSPCEITGMIQAVSRLHESVGSAEKEGQRTHIGEGEGSRSRPICSSPTSSVNSSVNSSWQLMSDITATDINPQNVKEGNQFDDKMFNLPKDTALKRDKDSGINSATPVDANAQESTLRTDDTDSAKKREQSAKELKAGLHDMFQLLKRQTSEAVNISLPSPPRAYSKMQETLGMSQWTELSASESTVLFHSSDESDSDGIP